MRSPADKPQQRVDPNSELLACAGFGFLPRGAKDVPPTFIRFDRHRVNVDAETRQGSKPCMKHYATPSVVKIPSGSLTHFAISGVTTLLDRRHLTARFPREDQPHDE
jgi:hypothetical protein